MTDYAPITDPSNTFNTAGISDEVEAMLDYLLCAKEAGLDVVATSTTDHPIKTASGNVSRHRMAGTNGEGLAIDCRRRQRGSDIHRAVFDAFVLVEHDLQELIYSGAPFNVKAGQRVQPYAVSAHHDHVHVSVVKGTILAWPGTRTTTPQEVAAMFPNHRFVRIDGDAMKFYSWDPSECSVYAWNGAPGPILSAQGQAKAKAAGGIRDLTYLPGIGLSAVVGNPGASATWPVWNFRDLAPEDRA